MIEDPFASKKKRRRTLTTAQKRDIIHEVGNKCQICKKKFVPSVLNVHHIKEVSKYKEKRAPFDFSMDVDFFGEKPKRKPGYDKKSNLIVLCPNCHAKYHRGIIKKSQVKKAKTKKRKKKAAKPRKPLDFSLGIDW